MRNITYVWIMRESCQTCVLRHSCARVKYIQIIGGVIALICAGVLVYSEVNSMLVVRDFDALKAAELLGAPK